MLKDRKYVLYVFRNRHVIPFIWNFNNLIVFKFCVIERTVQKSVRNFLQLWMYIDFFHVLPVVECYGNKYGLAWSQTCGECFRVKSVTTWLEIVQMNAAWGCLEKNVLPVIRHLYSLVLVQTWRYVCCTMVVYVVYRTLQI